MPRSDASRSDRRRESPSAGEARKHSKKAPARELFNEPAKEQSANLQEDQELGIEENLDTRDIDGFDDLDFEHELDIAMQALYDM